MERSDSLKKKLKEAVKLAFVVPPPVKKRAFLKLIPEKGISSFEFMIIQAGYINKKMWLFSLFVLGVAIAGTYGWKRDMLWIISSLLPFAALLAVTENAKSITYNVAEMEMASRFSLKSVLFARMGAVGAVHLILLTILIPVGQIYGARSFFETGVYMLLPYFAAIASGLWITRRLRGKEVVYVCTGFTILISGINIVINDERIFAYQAAIFKEKAIVAVILLILTVWEYKQSVQRTEELVWSL